MKNTALITGASSGIGLEFAKIHASKGDNLVLVARNINKLNELKAELETQFNIFIYTIEKDLSLVNSSLEVYEELKLNNIQIDYLINNAGFGDIGNFSNTSWEKELRMINLNITALTQLTKLFLKDMLARKKGKIMNLASTASFQPGPFMAVYFATKSYVLHFTEAINAEVKGSGVTLTALCPGPTKSGFQTAAEIGKSLLFNNKNPTSKEVAEYGYKSMMQGKSVAIHGFINYLMANSVRFTPRNWVVAITKKIQGK
jgi:short-subunit dehydrogenase